MKVIHVSFSDSRGGADRAAHRVHKAIESLGVDSRMLVALKLSDSTKVVGPISRRAQFMVLLRKEVARLLRNLLKSPNPSLHSPAVFGHRYVRALNRSDADVVHLHWVNGEMMSIKSIPRINKPLVWTLHDMWAFCGAEHYTTDSRWKSGYVRHNRPEGESGFDLNKWVWLRKKRHWVRPIQLVAPSEWLRTVVGQSALMATWPTEVIANPLNLRVWKPVEQSVARDILGLPQGVPLLLFGATGGTADPRKGFDLLVQAVDLVATTRDFKVVIFGQSAPSRSESFHAKTHFLGQVSDEVTLRLIYSAADVTVVPSRLDNLPSIATESLACGTPVVGFDNSGLKSIIRHQKTGYLARAFDVEDLAAGIDWVLSHRDSQSLRSAARTFSEEYLEQSLVAAKYLQLYRNLCRGESRS
jgi:glycosyltransferase involved in cell wall biosynthesis